MEIITQAIFTGNYYFEKINNSEKLPKPDYVDNWVTDFAEWIYKCTAGKSSYNAKRKGKIKEKEIDSWRFLASNNLLSLLGSEWRIIYKGVGDETCEPLTISEYTIRGECITGKPDYIFANDTTSTACIVEVKYSNKTMPRGGWPNARAQLWLYSKIDILKKYNNVYLYCENYGDDINGNAELKSNISFQSQDNLFNKVNLELFLKYKSYENELPNRKEFYFIESNKEYMKMADEFKKTYGDSPF